MNKIIVEVKDYFGQLWTDLKTEPVDPEVIKLGEAAMRLGLTEETMLGHVRASHLFQWRVMNFEKQLETMKREFGWDE